MNREPVSLWITGFFYYDNVLMSNVNKQYNYKEQGRCMVMSEGWGLVAVFGVILFITLIFHLKKYIYYFPPYGSEFGAEGEFNPIVTSDFNHHIDNQGDDIGGDGDSD